MEGYKKVYENSKDFVKDCIALKSMDYDEYKSYVEKLMGNDPNRFPYEEMNPVSAWSQSNYRFLCHRVEIGDDVVATFLKWVCVGNIPYGRLLNYPISMKGIVENQNEVMKYLISLPFIREVMITEGITKNVVGDVIYNDFYTNVNERYTKVNSSKWKSKRGINKILSNFDVKYVCYDVASDALADVKYVYNRWVECAPSRGLKANHKNAEIKMISEENPYKDAVKACVMYIDDVPVGYNIVEIFNDKICRVHHNKSVYDGDFKLLKIYKDYLMHYLMINQLKQLGMEWVFYGYASEGGDSYAASKKLIEFKKINFDRCVKYRRIRLPGKGPSR